MYYYAYGSNMSIKRIQARIDTKPVPGIFKLSDHRLVFNKAGIDGSAKANVVSMQGDCVYGKLFVLSDANKSILDEVEGDGYVSHQITVSNNEGECKQAYCYIGVKLDNDILPFDWYLMHIIKGASEAGLPTEYIERLRSVQTLVDLNEQRRARELAIYT